MAKKIISPFAFCAINIAAVLGLKELPIMATLGLESIFFFLFVALFFFIPFSLIVAELGSTCPSYGGIYSWVKAEYNKNLGFFAIWLYWIKNIIGYPMALSIFASIILYVISPNLATNKYLIVIIMLSAYWFCTVVNFYGIKLSKSIITWGVIIGTVIPILLIIILTIFWLMQGNQSDIKFTIHSFLPYSLSKQNLALMLSIVFGYSGIEMSAAYIKDLENPRKNYPLTIFISLFFILLMSILPTLGIAIVINKGNINFVSSFIIAISIFLNKFKLHYLIFYLATSVSLGMLTNMFTWIVGPSKSLLKSTSDGCLPKFMQKTNRYDVPTNIVIIQGIVVTCFSFVFVFSPTINESYWILINVAAILYVIIVILLILSAISARFKNKNFILQHHYQVPGGMIGLLFIGGVCMATCVLVLIFSFIPPANININNPFLYETILIALLTCFIMSPIIIRKIAK